MAWRGVSDHRRDPRARAGSLLLLGVIAALLAGTLILFGLGDALGARAKHQRAADLAAISAAQVMRDLYPRLFEPPFLEPDVPNPRHLEEDEYRASAVAAAIRGQPDPRSSEGHRRAVARRRGRRAGLRPRWRL
jgi:hypothetical protein